MCTYAFSSGEVEDKQAYGSAYFMMCIEWNDILNLKHLRELNVYTYLVRVYHS